jgi:hypothetical protein
MRKLAFLLALTTAGALLGSAPAAAQTTPEVTAFCDAALKVDKALTPLFEGGKPSKKAQQRIDTALSEAESVAAQDIAASVQSAASILRRALRLGREQDFENPELEQAGNAIDEYRYNSCGYTQLDVTGIEYEFQGLPKTVPAGEVAIRFTDNGAEFHELQVLRIKSKDSVKKLAGLSEKELAKKTEEIGGTFAEQGQTSYTIAELSKPGRYVVICHLPVGSTSEEAAEEAGKKHDTKSHAQEGMVQEIKVESSGSTTTTAAS